MKSDDKKIGQLPSLEWLDEAADGADVPIVKVVPDPRHREAALREAYALLGEMKPYFEAVREDFLSESNAVGKMIKDRKYSVS